MHTELGGLLCERLDLEFVGTFYFFHLTLCAERGENCRSHQLKELVSHLYFDTFLSKELDLVYVGVGTTHKLTKLLFFCSDIEKYNHISSVLRLCIISSKCFLSQLQ